MHDEPLDPREAFPSDADCEDGEDDNEDVNPWDGLPDPNDDRDYSWDEFKPEDDDVKF